MYDVVICVGPRDLELAYDCIARCKRYAKGANKIYTISKNKICSDTIHIDEASFPFNKRDIQAILPKVGDRAGWYFQQLLKLYAHRYISDLSNNYLVVDADLMMTREIEFISNDDKNLLCYGSEYHQPYFKHMSKLHPTLNKLLPVSGISHHMMFNSEILEHLIQSVEEYTGKTFWKAFLESISKEDAIKSGASEYEIYFTWCNKHFPERIKVRPLRWENRSSLGNTTDIDYVCLHWYRR